MDVKLPKGLIPTNDPTLSNWSIIPIIPSNGVYQLQWNPNSALLVANTYTGYADRGARVDFAAPSDDGMYGMGLTIASSPLWRFLLTPASKSLGKMGSSAGSQPAVGASAPHSLAHISQPLSMGRHMRGYMSGTCSAPAACTPASGSSTQSAALVSISVILGVFFAAFFILMLVMYLRPPRTREAGSA
jgi:hypothetical protein